MKFESLIAGLVLIIFGVGMFFVYDGLYKPQKEAKQAIAQAKMILERGDRESVNSAINLMTGVIAKYPNSKYVPEASFVIADAYEKSGLQRLAYIKYLYLIKNNPKISAELRKETQIRLARIKAMKSLNEEAINQLYSLLNSNYDPEYRSKVYYEIGQVYQKGSDNKKALETYELSLKESGMNEEAMIAKARSLRLLGRDTDAYDVYDSFLKYHGALSQYTDDVNKAYKDQLYASGINSYRAGNYYQAITYFQRFLAKFPNDTRVENSLYWIGESYYSMKRFDDAISYFSRVLNNNFYQKDEDARIKKGYAYFMSKRFELAAREFQVYLKDYQNGKHSNLAKEWKSMSTKELLYKLENSAPKTGEVDSEDDNSDDNAEDDETAGTNDEEVSGQLQINVIHENVAEL